MTEKSRARLSNAMDRKAHMAGDLGVSLRFGKNTNSVFVWTILEMLIYIYIYICIYMYIYIYIFIYLYLYK